MAPTESTELTQLPQLTVAKTLHPLPLVLSVSYPLLLVLSVSMKADRRT